MPDGLQSLIASAKEEYGALCAVLTQISVRGSAPGSARISTLAPAWPDGRSSQLYADASSGYLTVSRSPGLMTCPARRFQRRMSVTVVP